MRYLFLAFVILMTAPAFAQSDAIFETGNDAMTTDEYKQILRGMMLTPEERLALEEKKKKEAEEAKKAAAAAATLTAGVETSAAAIEAAKEPQAKEAPAETKKEGPLPPTALPFDAIVKLYRTGKFDDALKALEPLAAQKHHAAEELLGVMYRLGQGVAVDPTRAFHLLSAAAQDGRPLAAHHLGSMYFAGQGTSADPTRALMWLEASILHYPDGPEKQQARQDRDNVFTQVTPEQQIEAKRLLREWLGRRGEDHLMEMQ
jgi:hypothetical protein